MSILLLFFSLHKISQGFFFLNNSNFYQFSQQHFPIPNNSQSESANLSHTWFRQNSVHLLIIFKILFQNIFPKAPLQGELTKYLSTSSDTKNICLLVTLPPRRDHFQLTRTTTSPRQYPCLQ